jgi:SpoVK/Ycf46/Vps4 family AAA+-type ATPase
VKVNLIHTWDNLVLPPVTLQQVREVASAARNTHVIYSRWQFGKRFNEGRGIKAMFNGASGTGKTMTAGVIARDLGLDLYKVDLSGVVSKYIGETEKNLDRVFEAASAASAILFFDEADALFGKRSEVKDAHDRYANIEIAYLLQKLEMHEGTVILATNIGNNIDEAFSRRMQYVVEFPLPDETHRELLWRGMFPPKAPLAKDVDFSFLARQFPISGGEIRNAALHAAFLAAQEGNQIRMIHLMQAMARLVYKQGRLPAPQDFGTYYEKITR